MKTILVATDFSPAATNAAHYAAQMAMAINGDLFLLHTFEVPFTYGEIPIAVDLEELKADSEVQILALKRELDLLTNNSLTITTEVKMGKFFDRLDAVCDALKPFAIVMGSQGTTAAERIMFGSHATNAVKDLGYTVITVPPKATFSSIKRIGVACDIENVLNTFPAEEVKKMVNDFKAELFILNTGKINEYDPELVHDAGILTGMLSPVEIKFHFISNPDVNEGILDFTDSHKIDLLMVFPKRRRFLEKLLYRSHTNHFVLHSHVPVMAIH